MAEIVYGVIVTYNRKDLLFQNLVLQSKQIRKLDRIIVIDNGGNDGTYEYLTKNKIDFNWVIYIRLEKNIGCAGAFAKGIEMAFSNGANWAYVMDDDGRPFDEKTLLNLLNKINTMHLSSAEMVLANSLVQIDENHLSFKLFESFDKNVSLSHVDDGIIQHQAKLWNGSLISRGLYETIGGPNSSFGFKGEEVDYKSRASKSGAHIFTVFDSFYFHPQIKESHVKILWKTNYFSFEPDWKYYYSVRNRIFMLVNENKRIRAYLFYLKFRLCAKKLCEKNNWKLTKKTIRIAKRDGFKKKLGLIDFDEYIKGNLK